jgi:2-(1,2-epoxy-1,2-dihydrophenyl)acetyl-CoA isomerase
MWSELLDTFLDIRKRRRSRRRDHRAGGNFCSGADLSGGGAEEAQRRHQLAVMRHIGDAALALHRMPKPTIAKVKRRRRRGRCNLALGCDLIAASDEARFSEIFARRGLTIDFGGSWILPRLVGMHRAKELARSPTSSRRRRPRRWAS